MTPAAISPTRGAALLEPQASAKRQDRIAARGGDQPQPISRPMDSLSELDVLFVGNSLNDIYASRSGARTLCVNPHLTNPEIEEHWTYCIPEMRNLKQILQHVKI